MPSVPIATPRRPHMPPPLGRNVLAFLVTRSKEKNAKGTWPQPLRNGGVNHAVVQIQRPRFGVRRHEFLWHRQIVAVGQIYLTHSVVPGVATPVLGPGSQPGLGRAYLRCLSAA